ncbi:hypothetical protein ACLOJK_026706 [Asimina triloba]
MILPRAAHCRRLPRTACCLPLAFASSSSPVVRCAPPAHAAAPPRSAAASPSRPPGACQTMPGKKDGSPSSPALDLAGSALMVVASVAAVRRPQRRWVFDPPHSCFHVDLLAFRAHHAMVVRSAQISPRLTGQRWVFGAAMASPRRTQIYCHARRRKLAVAGCPLLALPSSRSAAWEKPSPAAMAAGLGEMMEHRCRCSDGVQGVVHLQKEFNSQIVY